MKRTAVILIGLMATLAAEASWYWPFGSDTNETEREEPRLSELIRPASKLIDEATDLADDGKTDEAIAKYRAALVKLDEIERNNPERAKKPEFATLRNKRAFVNATIDSLVMNEARENARSVAVTDTTALEKKLADEKKRKLEEKRKGKEKGKVKGEEKKVKGEVGGEGAAETKEAQGEDALTTEKGQGEEKVGGEGAAETKGALATTPQLSNSPATERAMTPRERVIADLEAGDFDAAKLSIANMLDVNPTDPVALNLKALIEIGQGNLVAAEQTLDDAIRDNPKSPSAYVNMAMLYLRKVPSDKVGARRYYNAARELGAPAQAEIEEALK